MWVIHWVWYHYSQQHPYIWNTVFLKNRKHSLEATKTGAGAILAVASSLHFNGTNNFFDNVKSAMLANGRTVGGGGAIHINNTALTFHGKNNFINNSAGFGGAIYTSPNTVLTFHGSNNFIGNSADNDGGAILTSHGTILTFNGTTNFINNSVLLGDGGAIITHSTEFTFNGTNNFINNSADGFGGAISSSSHYRNIVLSFTGNNNFIGNSATFCCGAIFADNILLTFTGTSNFSNNSAESGGAIVTFDNVVLTFNGTNNFTGNSADFDGGAIYIDTNISLIFTGTSSFISNSAMLGGAISANHNSTLIFNGNISFTNNGHKYKLNNEESLGGALYLFISATLNILPHTTVCFENNHANLGGAIYVSDLNPLIYCAPITKYVAKEECFFQLPGQNIKPIDIKLVFKNNSADMAGSVLYGGAVDSCKLNDLNSSSSGAVFDKIFQIEDDYSTTSMISSDPIRICLCENNLPYCSPTWMHGSPNSGVPYLVYPGETFQVFMVATGQRDETVPSTVRSVVSTIEILPKSGQPEKSINFGPVNLLDYQYLQHTNNTCTKLTYTVFSLSRKCT